MNRSPWNHDNTDAPDLTDRIMSRLGYLPATGREARRMRRRRQTERAVLVATLLLMVLLAVSIHSRSDFARQPTMPSLPAAVGEEIEHRQRQFDRAIRTIRTLAPAPRTSPVPGNAPDIDGDVERSAVGPMRWL